VNSYRNHQNEIIKLKKELSRRFPEGRLRDSTTGMFYRKPNWNNILKILSLNVPVMEKLSKIKRCLIPIRINKPGHPDNYFTIAVKGIPIVFYIETKTGTGRLTKDQLEYREQLFLTNMIYILNRNHIETADTIEIFINDFKGRIK